MKLHLSFVCALLLVFPSCISFSAIQGFNWKITLRVVDQDGVPVEGATASVGYHLLTDGRGGQGTGDEKLTNVSGEATFSNRSYMPIYLGARKEGYYESRFGTYDFETTRLRRWMPWNPTVEIELKEIRNPVPMYAKDVRARIPADSDGPIGFDLEKGDWVKPYGEGTVSDFIFDVESEVEPHPIYERSRLWDSTLRLAFSNDGDGLILFKRERDGNVFLSMHEAPEDGYAPYREWRRFRRLDGEPRSRDDEDKSNHYYFRIRTELDADGNVIEAMYGKIYYDIRHGLRFLGEGRASLNFMYYLNPDGSRNMEFDPERNLFSKEERQPKDPMFGMTRTLGP